MSLQFTVATSAAMQKLGGRLASVCDAGCVIYLQGELGAGKTTLTRGFLRQFGYSGHVKSPTFNLFEIYQLKEQLICHFDLYRLTNPEELLYIGAADYFTGDNICLIEWPEHGKGFLQSADLLCKLDFAEDGGRLVEIVAISSKGKENIKKLGSVD